MDQKLFMEIISGLRDVADAQNGRLLHSQIEERTDILRLAPEQMNSVLEYLKAHNISVTDSLEESFPAKSEKKAAKMRSARQGSMAPTERELYRAYMQELELLEICTIQEEAKLLAQIAAGNELARNRLIEGSLHLVAHWAEEFSGQGVAITDLIQEGNMALVQFVQETDGADFQTGLYQNVRRALQSLVDVDRGNANVKEVLVNRANRLLEVSAELAEELGKEPTLAQLAERLHLTEDEVTQVMKMSMEAMNIEEKGFGGFGGQ